MEKNKSLVLVLGAGASKEANLPIGDELKHRIAKCLDFKFDDFGSSLKSGNPEVMHALQLASRQQNRSHGDINQLFQASRLICGAMPMAISIDNFIDSHRNDDRVAFCGKLAIAQSILEAEANSKLYVKPGNIYNKPDFKAIEKTWFNSFFQLLTENCEKENLPARLQDIAVICFNYDRCLEQYLYFALQEYYGISADESARLLTSLEIHHPYGKVGALPWMPPSNGNIAYGATPNYQQLIEISKLLRTFTEGTDPSVSDINSIRATVAGANRVVFLGFAFHRLNLDLLFPGTSTDTTRIYATALNISESNCSGIKNELANKAHYDRDYFYLRNDLTCSQLFTEYSRSLSLS